MKAFPWKITANLPLNMTQGCFCEPERSIPTSQPLDIIPSSNKSISHINAPSFTSENVCYGSEPASPSQVIIHIFIVPHPNYCALSFPCVFPLTSKAGKSLVSFICHHEHIYRRAYKFQFQQRKTKGALYVVVGHGKVVSAIPVKGDNAPKQLMVGIANQLAFIRFTCNPSIIHSRGMEGYKMYKLITLRSQ